MTMAEPVQTIEAETPPGSMDEVYSSACSWVRAVLRGRTIDSRLWALSQLLRTLGVDPTGPLAMRPTKAPACDPART